MASTFELDKKVRESAMKLKRGDLLAKLSSGDMIAIEAKYHARCLVSLYNDVRKPEIKSNSEEEKSMSSLHGIAFASLVSYLEDHRESGETSPVFKLADLGSLYSEKLQGLGIPKSSLNINTTRLKERLLAAIPDLTAHTQGKHILLVFNDTIGDAIRKACEQDYDSEALQLARAARIVRRDMFSLQQSFKGTFEIDCQKKSVPASVLALVSMIIEGPSIKKDNKEIEEEDQAITAALTISQLLSFNSCKQGRAGKTVRHRRERECPLPVYTALKIHGETRKRSLVEVMHKLGLCISYDRVMDISTDLANSVTAQFEKEGVVCPPKLRKDVFTTAAIDNIDHNPSSTTASDSFHGTAISLVQHPTATIKGTERGTNVIDGTVQEVKAISELPIAFCNVPPAVLLVNDPIVPEPPSGYIGLEHGTVTPVDVPEEEEFRWLRNAKELASKATLEKGDFISWAAFHASRQPTTAYVPAVISLLPMFYENAHSIAMILHAMNMIKAVVNHLNPGQTPVIALDQPLFALGKLIQWNWPSTHGEKNFILMLGGLHIEMAAFKLLGDWLDGSGWTSALVAAEVATGGVADSFIKATHVTRTRRVHQVTATCLFILQSKAYSDYLGTLENGEEPLQFTDWVNKMSKERPQFLYWNRVLFLELCVLQLVRAIREGNFSLYKTSLVSLVPWMFSLDHINYARWMSVHIRDMNLLSSTHPDIHQEFTNGSFVVHKTEKVFSSIALDHAHEQVNAQVKGEGGAVGLTENPAALRRWMIAGPEVARIIQEFEETYSKKVSEAKRNHHEQIPGVQAAFKKYV